jgi:hypothetical protein
MELEIPTNERDYISHYLQLMNGLFQLTDRERECLVEFIKYDSKNACCMQARKHVAAAMNFKSVSVLNNYVKSLKDKRVIQKTKGGSYVYHPSAVPDYNNMDIRFKFVKQPDPLSTNVPNGYTGNAHHV